MPTCFIDTNILLYAKDTTENSKLKIANKWIETLLRRNLAVLSAQSLREYYSNMLRLDRRADAVRRLRVEMAALDTLVPDDLRLDRLTEAWALQDRHRLSFWDAMHLASALAAGCAFFLSEDMNDRQKIETLTIVNPFTTAPEAVLGA
jgi:predicted nucleic acid-binding protein